jgi:hypothetical protein
MAKGKKNVKPKKIEGEKDEECWRRAVISARRLPQASPASRGLESITPPHTRKEDLLCFAGSRGHWRSLSEGLDGCNTLVFTRK